MYTSSSALAGGTALTAAIPDRGVLTIAGVGAGGAPGQVVWKREPIESAAGVPALRSSRSGSR